VVKNPACQTRWNPGTSFAIAVGAGNKAGAGLVTFLTVGDNQAISKVEGEQ